jgi:hypothetical protein
MKLAKLSALLAPIAIVSAWPVCARAQEVVVSPTPEGAPAPAPAQATSETVTGKGGPSRMLLTSGLVTFGLSYGAGVVVAGTSGLDADHRLFVPIVGPWTSLGDRPDCGGATGRSCDAETANKVLLVADGIGQALGAFMIVDAFLNPETVTITRSRVSQRRPTLHIAPTPIGVGGYGMLAAATF